MITSQTCELGSSLTEMVGATSQECTLPAHVLESPKPSHFRREPGSFLSPFPNLSGWGNGPQCEQHTKPWSTRPRVTVFTDREVTSRCNQQLGVLFVDLPSLISRHWDPGKVRVYLFMFVQSYYTKESDLCDVVAELGGLEPVARVPPENSHANRICPDISGSSY